MAVERIHLVLEPHLMKAFREMSEKNRRSISGQFAFMVEEEIDRQRQPLHHRMVGDLASRENDSHLPNP
jgi:hypothetical protein|tara:strand:+ start:459 stop:665 length:207 start_codon:yes stop_codon:yes gene_type:complete